MSGKVEVSHAEKLRKANEQLKQELAAAQSPIQPSFTAIKEFCGKTPDAFASAQGEANPYVHKGGGCTLM
eukprot:m.174096 g.174096  ORF g.174096 m.174096 type:complete len:70 (-) comp53292_c0_seq3:1355-1564(-)